MLAVVDGNGQNEVSGPTVLSWDACAMVRNGDVDVANCGSVPLNTIINSSLNRSQVPLSTSSPQPSVFQSMSSGSSTGPERITKSSSRYCFSMKKSVVFPELMLHIALFFVLSDSHCYLGYHRHDLGCKSRDSQRRRPWVDQLALYLTYVVLRPNYQEDEAMLRGILEDSGRYPFAVKHTRIEFTLEVRLLKTKLSMSWWRVTISSWTRGQPIIHLALLTRVF